MEESPRLKALRDALDVLRSEQILDVAKSLERAIERELQPHVESPQPEGGSGNGRYFRSVFVVEVLSDGAPLADDTPLNAVAEAIDCGDCVGVVAFDGASQLNAQQMEQALLAAGSEPSFFMQLPDDLCEERGDGDGHPRQRAG